MQFAHRLRIGLTVMVLIAPFSFSLAQKTQVYEQNEERYYHAVELYNKEIFGPAAEEFERFLSLETEPGLLTSKATVYAMMSHMQLDHENYYKKLDRYIKKNPQNSMHNLAMFEMGNYLFNNRKYRKAAKYYDELNIKNLPKEYWEEAHFKMGYSFFKTKDYEQASAHFNKLRKPTR